MSKSLFKSTSVVSAMTLVSRLLGFVRDMIAAQIFGAGPAVDAFYIAFKLPNFMRSMFAEGAFSQAFVPVLSEYRETRSPEEVQTFVSHISGCLGSALLIVTLLGEIFAPLIILLFAPGLDPYRFHLATEMLRVTFPYLMFISLTAFSGAILNSYGTFSVPSFTPTLLNISLISAALWLSPHFHVPVESQAWGVLAAGVLQLLFQMPFLRKKGFLVLPRLNFQDEGVRRVLKLMLPALFGASVVQISLLLNTVFASFLKSGSITWLYFSDRLIYFPLGVFGVALATVVLPHLSRKHADKNSNKTAKSQAEFRAVIDWGIRCNLLIGLPCTFALALFGGPVITTLFQYGKFTPFDVMMTRESLIAYAVGLQAFMLVKLLATAFYSRQNIKTPVRYAMITLALNICLNAALIVPLAHAGLALATSISSWLNVSLLYFGLKKSGAYQLQKGWAVFAMRLMFANSMMVIFLWWKHGTLSQWFGWSWHARFAHLILYLIVAGLIYIVSLLISGMRLKDFKSSDFRKA